MTFLVFHVFFANIARAEKVLIIHIERRKNEDDN